MVMDERTVVKFNILKIIPLGQILHDLHIIVIQILQLHLYLSLEMVGEFGQQFIFVLQIQQLIVSDNFLQLQLVLLNLHLQV
ncbi:TPA: hypothetical protein DEG21_03475 [Patescibacteria group bacterium]|nr:hypothetical protein [Candidatus Gracilibacteria bacterium]HBY74916.1 hypothetical protein [Candidatus Gracilibacteria bacterium]